MESRSERGNTSRTTWMICPLCLLVTATFFDIAGILSGYSAWHQAAYWMIGVGTVAGIIAVLPGFIYWLTIPMGTHAKFYGFLLGLLKIVVLALFAIAWLLRRGETSVFDPGWLPIILQIVALGIASISAWFCRELMKRLGVVEDSPVHRNAPLPNPLTRRRIIHK